MNRYLNSFFITLFVYVTLGSFVFWFFKKDFIKPKEQTKTISLNNLTILETPKVEKIQPIEKDKPKEIIEKKLIKKVEETKKESIKKVSKNIKKDSKINKPIKKEIVENSLKKAEKIVEFTQKTKKEEPIKTPQKNIIDEKKDYLDKNLFKIRELISKKVIYPNRAKKFAIQGVVLVEFKILPNGDIENIKILEGNRFFHNSTIEAIKEASREFPKVSKELQIQLPIEYKLI